MRLVFLSALALAVSTTFAVAGEGDAVKGKKVFKKCKACHTLDEGGKNLTGPNLFGIIGAEAGKSEGYKYSKGFKAKAEEGFVWDEDNLQAWLENPKKFVPKAKMVLKLKKQKDRDNLIAYLKEQM